MPPAAASHSPPASLPANPRTWHILASCVLMSCLYLTLLSCTPEQQITSTASSLLPSEITLASAHLEANRPDLALAILAADRTHPRTRQLVDQTIWHLPAAHIEHPGFDVHHIAIDGQSLWVALAHPPFHTIVRWNLDALELEAVLFPTRDTLRVFVLSPTFSHAVITRGEVSLLIDAHTLKPIADLGTIPTGITPESAITFSTDSLLLAHPADAAWHIRDTTTGQIIRTIAADELPGSPVLAAHLDSQNLRLLAADGTRIDAPVSPVEPITIEAFDEEPLEILHAHLIDHGTTAIIIRNLGPHEPPTAIEFNLVEKFPLTHFDIDAWASHQSHSALPGLATGLLRHFDPPPVQLTENAAIFHGHPQAPLLSSWDLQSQSVEGPARRDCPLNSPPKKTTLIAYASDPTTATLATAESSGRVTLHQHIPAPENPTTEILTALSGHQYHRETATFTPLTAQTRGWDLQSQSVAGTSSPQPPPTFHTTTPAHLLPLIHRLTDSLPPNSPELETLPLVDHSPTDHSPAHALAKALTKDDPTPIATILESPENLPPTLRTLAISHIHHRQGNTAAAFAPYHNDFPNIDAIRLREDWHGWEQPDFQPAVTTLENTYQSIIATLTIDPAAEETARLETITRLTNSATVDTLGRKRYATACLDAATALTLIAGEAEHAFTLAALARHHGAPVVPCLRTEALALTALEKFAEAHTRWIALITDHPAADHLPDDYAEAAYTAFENADSRQALEILITGMHRFGDQPSFALRSGWIALLTGHPDHARVFLLKGLDAGFPEDELEHATALLTASAALINDAASAASHFQDLITLDPAWASPETIEALPWPDHLKAPLRQLTW